MLWLLTRVPQYFSTAQAKGSRLPLQAECHPITAHRRRGFNAAVNASVGTQR